VAEKVAGGPCRDDLDDIQGRSEAGAQEHRQNGVQLLDSCNAPQQGFDALRYGGLVSNRNAGKTTETLTTGTKSIVSP
jgi:hypothetical protein